MNNKETIGRYMRRSASALTVIGLTLGSRAMAAGADDAGAVRLPDLEVTVKVEFGARQPAGSVINVAFTVENKGKARATDAKITVLLPAGVSIYPGYDLNTLMKTGNIFTEIPGVDPAEVSTGPDGVTSAVYDLGQWNSFFTPQLEPLAGAIDPGVINQVNVPVYADMPQLVTVTATASSDNGDSRLRNNTARVGLEYVALP